MREKWIRASEAREIACPGWKQNGGPTDGICHEAKVGRVLATAELYIEDRPGQPLETPQHPVPKEFWAAEGLKQNWGHGRFSGWVVIDGRKTHCEAFGVTFQKSGIDAIAPATVVRSNPSKSAGGALQSKGGRPATVDWEFVMIEMARQLHNGDLSPRTQADLEAAISEYLLGPGAKYIHDGKEVPAESTIRNHARPLWNGIRDEVKK